MPDLDNVSASNPSMVRIIRRYMTRDSHSDSPERMTISEKAFGPHYGCIKNIVLSVIDTDLDLDFDDHISPIDVLKHFLNHAVNLGYKSNFKLNKYKEFTDLAKRLPNIVSL